MSMFSSRWVCIGWELIENLITSCLTFGRLIIGLLVSRTSSKSQIKSRYWFPLQSKCRMPPFEIRHTRDQRHPWQHLPSLGHLSLSSLITPDLPSLFYSMHNHSGLLFRTFIITCSENLNPTNPCTLSWDTKLLWQLFKGLFLNL